MDVSDKLITALRNLPHDEGVTVTDYFGTVVECCYAEVPDVGQVNHAHDCWLATLRQVLKELEEPNTHGCAHPDTCGFCTPATPNKEGA
jgi:hypothetical protein